MRYFITSDIHGHYTELKQALDNKGFNKDADTLVICGDLLDRGKENVKCLQYVNSLPNKVLIKGNHEYNLEKCLREYRFNYADKHNGTADTILEIAKYVSGRKHLNVYDREIYQYANQYIELNQYLNSLQDYFEFTNSNNNTYVCCHGWLPRNYQDKDCKNFEEYSWLNGMEQWHQGNTFKDKIIICGHWHTSYGNAKFHNHGTEFGKDADFEPFIDKGIIALDACTTVTKKVNIVIIEGESTK
jgi:serine/threonine-protein phosphatase